MQYLNGSGTWEFGVRTARNFERIHLAVEYCIENRLKSAHVIMGMLDASGGFDPASKTILHVPRRRQIKTAMVDGLERNATPESSISPGANPDRHHIH